MANEYEVRRLADGFTHEIHHKPSGEFVSTIDVYRPPHDPKTTLYRVNNQAHASAQDFDTFDSAVQHSLITHQDTISGRNNVHAMHHVATKINEIGKLIWEASENPAYKHELHKLQKMSKAHALFAANFNDEYGPNK